MPVRIYELSRKLGIENKVIIARAKELGITGAKVPSSSLDKITAEYLENELSGLKKPEETKDQAAPEPILIVKAPAVEEKVEPTPEPVVDTPDAPESAEEPAADDIIPSPVAASTQATVVDDEQAVAESESESESEFEPVAEEVESPAPPQPKGPKIGEKVGFIQLPTRPGNRTGGRISQGRAAGGRAETAKGRVADGASATGAGAARAAAPAKPKAPPQIQVPDSAEILTIKPPIIVRDLAEKLNRKPHQVIADLFELKVMASVNQAIEEEIARQLCAKYGFRFEVEKRERGGGIVHSHQQVPVLVEEDDKAEDLKPRPPVVTIMGHVDHGKTTLLDVIRKSNVVAGEAGGITQHVGAYTISVPHPDPKQPLHQITFLDTPGHAAFSAMRARGADVTDIVVLVVAANDGVMPQTLEALAHARAASVPIIVAVNKCDAPNANPMKVRQELQERELAPDEWGGDTIFVDVSALKKQGVDKLLEMILLQAELLELKANPSRLAKGNVIESGLAAGGPTASVLVRNGTLRTGDTVICGEFWGRVRALINEEGERLKEAGPSTAVKILGMNGVPVAGLEFNSVKDEKTARLILGERAELAQDLRRSSAAGPMGGGSVDDLLMALAKSQVRELKVVVKADTQGSAEAIVDSLNKIESDKVTLKVIHNAVGTVTENDVHLASASRALILGFHTRLDNGVADLAKHNGVTIKLYSIIYELIDEVKLAMAGLLAPDLKESVIGSAEVRKVFDLSKGGSVAGCIVNSGRINRGKVRVLRKRNLLFEGTIQSLRRFQDEVNEVRSGMECGIRVDGFREYQEGDTIECFMTEKIAATL